MKQIDKELLDFLPEGSFSIQSALDSFRGYHTGRTDAAGKPIFNRNPKYELYEALESWLRLLRGLVESSEGLTGKKAKSEGK